MDELNRLRQRYAELGTRIKRLEQSQSGSENEFQVWVTERCVTAPIELAGVQIPRSSMAKPLYDDYCEYCQAQSIQPRSAQAWGRWMTARYLNTREAAGRRYTGIALKPPTPDTRDT